MHDTKACPLNDDKEFHWFIYYLAENHEKEKPFMHRTNSLKGVASLITGLLLVWLILPSGEVSRSALAQTLPPRPTLTPEPPTPRPEHHQNHDEATDSPTPVATATLAPMPAPPPPITLPVTGGSSGNGGGWIALGIGLVVGGAGIRRAVQRLRGHRPT